MDDLQKLGFASEAEFYGLVGNVDLGSAEKLKAFKAWQNGDGTKEGLLRLPTA